MSHVCRIGKVNYTGKWLSDYIFCFKRYNSVSWNSDQFNSNQLFKIYIPTLVHLVQKKYFCENFGKSPDRIDSNSQKYPARNEIKAYIQLKKNKLKNTEERIKSKGTSLLRDIKQTKDKVYEKVETIIEKENIYTIPNLLCISRIIISPYLGMLIVQADFNIALAVLGVAAITDLLDGWIARTWESQSSKMGSFLDPVADKVMIATLFLALTYANLIPIPLTGIIITRDVLLIIGGFVIRYRSLPDPKTLRRYFDVTHATVQLAPTFISKVNTTVQLILVGTTLAAPVFHFVGHPFLEYLWYVTGFTTIAAGLSYVLSKNTYKYLRKKT
ncbi:hypothetical protein WA026_015821 [Henosepilachna vigintioctopunctata]|uniref:cardiolipin synthase (CMP-forming) n=1 Tax=Henosepilachna vigintioctopunctata TaxID=420089 RepID=A0AAW1V249_9CUCU